MHPPSIPDFLALVGDSSDGYPGLPGWGPTSAAGVLGRYRRLEDIPADDASWDVRLQGRVRLAGVLRQNQALVHLFRDLATLRTDGSPFAAVDDLRWRGPTPAFEKLAADIDAPQLWERATRLASAL